MVTVPSFADVQLLLKGHLERLWRREQGVEMWVSTDIPNPRPAEFIRVLIVGGEQINRITDRPTVSIEGWANSSERAVQIAGLSRAYVHALENTMLDGVQVGRVRSSPPVELPYPDTDQSRYTFTGSLDLSYSSILTL